MTDWEEDYLKAWRRVWCSEKAKQLRSKGFGVSKEDVAKALGVEL